MWACRCRRLTDSSVFLYTHHLPTRAADRLQVRGDLPARGEGAGVHDGRRLHAEAGALGLRLGLACPDVTRVCVFKPAESNDRPPAADIHNQHNTQKQTQIIDMEAFMLATLKFQVTVCTAHAFLVRFLKAGHADKCVALMCVCARLLHPSSQPPTPTTHPPTPRLTPYPSNPQPHSPQILPTASSTSWPRTSASGRSRRRTSSTSSPPWSPPPPSTSPARTAASAPGYVRGLHVGDWRPLPL